MWKIDKKITENIALNIQEHVYARTAAAAKTATNKYLNFFIFLTFLITWL